RTAGYHGPNIFSAAALKLIASASNGLMRRVNILADKSLLAAFVEDTHNIEVRHVLAAMRDSAIKPPRTLPGKPLLWAGGTAAALLAGLTTWQLLKQTPAPAVALPTPQANVQADVQVAEVAAPPAATQPPITEPTAAPPARETIAAVPPPAQPAPEHPAPADPAPPRSSLFAQRLAAGQQLLAKRQHAASIQLFYSEENQPGKIEGFLKRAEGLGKLSDIYLLPAKSGSKEGLRVLYGAYPSADAARNAIKDLPTRYQEAFATSIYIF
ncbi:MAG TPA: hypothetical protein VFW59_00900, partial [Gallionella sp.]|nr:hypothetical protein [Gallionella sp.]